MPQAVCAQSPGAWLCFADSQQADNHGCSAGSHSLALALRPPSLIGGRDAAEAISFPPGSESWLRLAFNFSSRDKIAVVYPRGGGRRD